MEKAIGFSENRENGYLIQRSTNKYTIYVQNSPARSANGSGADAGAGAGAVDCGGGP